MNLKKIATYLLFIGISVLLLYLTFRKTDFADVFEKIKQVNYTFIVLSFLATMLSHLLRAWRWQLLLEPMGYRARLHTGFYSILIGYLANYAIPRGGEVARCGIMQRTDKIPIDKLFGTVVTERIIDVLLLMGIFGITCLVEYDTIIRIIDFNSLWNQHQTLIIGALALMLAGVAALFLFWKQIAQIGIVQKILGVLHGFTEGVMSVFKIKRQWLFWAQSVFIWVGFYFINFFFMKAMGSTAGMGPNVVLVVLMMGAVGFAIPTPGGAGSYHYIIKITLMLYALSAADADAYAFTSHAAQLLFIVIAGSISLILAMIEAGKKIEEDVAPGETAK